MTDNRLRIADIDWIDYRINRTGDILLNSYTIKSSDGSDLFVRSWGPTTGTDLRGVIQIAHGMGEHTLRYDWFAEKLTDRGFAVYANDHRGHGETAGTPDRLGHFADTDGWSKTVDDMKTLSDHIRTNHPDRPLFLFGHSMGSFLTRDYISRYSDGIAGVIISGTACDPGILGRIGLLIAKAQAVISGGNRPSPLMDKLSFGSYNKPFEPGRTAFDWLTRDANQVDAYIDDTRCGFICTAQFYVDLISGILKINSMAHISQTPVSLPILLFSGTDDPVGFNGAGVRKVHDAFRAAGIKDLSLKLYDGGRHEMLNEINREEVAGDVIAWLEARISQ
jgi:alpha-beta hydrolase superfamily lysophospholipase